MTRIRTLIVILLVLLGPAGAAFAQPPAAKAPAAAQDGFVPVDAPLNPRDTIPAPRLVAAAYGFIWVVLFAYLWSVRSRLSTVEREMESIGRRVASSQKQP